tara:strand:+ start:6880 stop:8559 length:1680 start_codon:yes stop_codon:yes gene_type:complete
MFFGKKERDLVKQVNDELAERIIGQPIAYYPISIEESDFNDTYGEAIDKVSLPPIRVFAYVEVENIQTNEKYGYEYQTKLTVNFNNKRLTEDQNLFVRVGDFIQYGDQFYEIVKTYNDTRYYFGQVEHKFQISTECIRARQGSFRVLPSIDRKPDRGVVAGETTSPAPRTAPTPPLNASYVTVTASPGLPKERVLTAGAGISIVDGGANSNVTISSTVATAQGPTGSLQLQAGAGALAGVSNLLFLTSSNLLTVTGTIGISGDLSSSANVSASYYYGDGRYLTGITASTVVVADGPIGSLQFREDAAGEVSGSGNLMFLTASSLLRVTGTVSIAGEITASTTISASSFHGDGSNLTGITTAAAGANTQIQYNSSGDFAGSSNFTFDGTTVAVAGNMTASANVSAGYFYGDGSNLTGITASAVNVADGPVGSLQFRVDTPVSGEISGSSKILYEIVNNRLSFGGGLVYNRTALASNYTASTDDHILAVTTVPLEILLDASLFSVGQPLVVKDESGVASVVDTIVLNASASQTIDGTSTAHIESPYGSVLLYSNGLNWFVY